MATDYKPSAINADDRTMFRQSSGWVMDQDVNDEMQMHPQHPLLFGIDGRFPGVLRRFRGFKRLDYDIRYPHSNAGFAHGPVVHSGIGGVGPNVSNGGNSVGKVFAAHDWSTLSPALGATSHIDPEASTIYQFVGGTLDRVRRNEGRSDRRPVSIFVIHMLDRDGKPVVKMLGRSIGDSGLGALFQSYLVGPNIRPIPSATVPAILDLRLKETSGEDIDWVGIGILGRFLFLSHKGDHPDTVASAGDSWLYEIPWKAWRGNIVGSTAATNRHNIALPEVNFPTVDNGFMQRGDKFTRSKLAGTRGWSWLHPISIPTTSSDGAVRNEGFATNTALNITQHAANELFRLRIRLVNYTTGFVGPMSQPLQMAIGPNKEGVKISWVPGTQRTGVGTTAGAVQFTQSTTFRNLLRSVFGVDINIGAASGADVFSAVPTPDTADQEGVYDVRLQIWVTQSVPADNPSGGGPYYYLDQEVPVVYRFPPFADPLLTGTLPHLWPGWLGEEASGSNLIGKRIPSRGNDELTSQAIYVAESDDVGDLEPTQAFGNASGCLTSLADGGAFSGGPSNAASGDLKVSPPWKSFPGGWAEATAPLFRHLVFPKGLTPPKFENVGDICFLIDQNRFVRIVRDGADILADDVDTPSHVNRDSVCEANGSLMIVTSDGLEEMNPVTLEMTVIRQVSRIISDKWQDYVQGGQIMSGYDPQLKAIFIAPRRALTSTAWLRSECLIVWVKTGRVTMLCDVYWVAMTRGVHPITGKKHLFFIDPAHNITYPDSALFDTAQPATMCGLNLVSDTGFTRNKAVWTITVTATVFGATATILVDGVPFTVDLSSSWTDASANTTTIATSIRDALNNYRAAFPGVNLDATTSSTNIVTITTRLTGTINDEFDFVSLLNIPTGMTVARVTAGETGGSALSAGGGFQGKVTTIAGTTTKTITDSNMNASNGGRNFDLYAWYNPHNAASAGIQPTISGLCGVQVYFFRSVSDANGVTRPTLVADVRIRTNTQQQFTYLEADVTYHNGLTSVLLDDQYCLSPVVMQVVGAPLDTGDFPGSGVNISGTIESLNVTLRNRKGTAKSSSSRLPAGITALQGALFFGVATLKELDDRVIGRVVEPALNYGGIQRLDKSDGTSGSVFWDETVMRTVVVATKKGGQSIFPVITLIGTDYQCDIIKIGGKAVRRGHVEDGVPEGVA